MFTISKTFNFEYAHRVFTQNVNPLLVDTDPENSCRRLHGHSGKLTVTLTSSIVDSRGFVVDYKELGFIKNIVNKYLDHHTILGCTDPLRLIISGDDRGIDIDDDVPEFYRFAIEESDSPFVKEYLSSFIIVNCVPTSENLAEYFYNLLTRLFDEYDISAKVQSVGWSETSSSNAIYSEEL